MLASYQRPVIMGFSRVEQPRLDIDVLWQVVAYGNRIAAGYSDEPSEHGLTAKRDEFWRWLAYAESIA
jgi:hypothetical protein